MSTTVLPLAWGPTGSRRCRPRKAPGLGAMFRAPDKLELRANTALLGVHMDDPDEAAFIAASAHVEDLTVWSRRTGIEKKIFFGSKADKVSGRIELSRLSPLSVDAGPLTVKLSHFAWQPFSEESRAQRATRVRESQVIRFEREDPQPLEYWLECSTSPPNASRPGRSIIRGGP